MPEEQVLEHCKTIDALSLKIEALVAERGGAVTFELRAGDAVLMDSLTWHAGGANTSDRTRTLLSASFEEQRARDGAPSRRAAQSLPRLGELMDGST